MVPEMSIAVLKLPTLRWASLLVSHSLLLHEYIAVCHDEDDGGPAMNYHIDRSPELVKRACDSISLITVEHATLEK